MSLWNIIIPQLSTPVVYNNVNCLHKGEHVVMLYLDLANAFDRCDISLLIHKTKELGINSKFKEN